MRRIEQDPGFIKMFGQPRPTEALGRVHERVMASQDVETKLDIMPLRNARRARAATGTASLTTAGIFVNMLRTDSFATPKLQTTVQHILSISPSISSMTRPLTEIAFLGASIALGAASRMFSDRVKQYEGVRAQLTQQVAEE